MRLHTTTAHRDSGLMMIGATGLAAGLAPWLGSGWLAVAVTGLAAAILAGATLALRTRCQGPQPFSVADRVTLTRLALTAVLAGQLAAPSGGPQWSGYVLAAAALTALALDGVDGWLARRRGETSAFGARLDMESDALLILVLATLVWRREHTGGWVLLIGAWRYIFILGQALKPALARPLPPSQRRKAICAVQVGVLPVCLIPALPAGLAPWLAGTALALLCYSFIVDSHWLIRHQTAQQPLE
jgi:phosphatidylglycerophosphate synthase